MLKRVAAVLAAAALTLGAVPAHADTGHKPGAKGFGVDLPADVMYGTVDGGVDKHPCAGRKLAYHSHMDALYGTRVDGQLAVMAVDGQAVVPMDDLCFRLAPDANADGEDVSRFVVPESEDFAFLGAPGDVVWVAPQAVDFTDNWRPIWTGIGAFDPAHEHEVPSDIEGGHMFFDLLDFSGPGDVSVFWGNLKWGQAPELDFHSADPSRHTISYEVGYHGHFNWAFTKPGIYKLTWQGRAPLSDGTTSLSTPTTQYWLVGSDEQTGLPAGTTVGLRDAGSPAPSPSSPAPAAPPQAERCYAASALASTPSAFISDGHADIALQGTPGNASVQLNDDSDPRARTQRPSGTFALEVSDQARTVLPDGYRTELPGSPKSLWLLPQTQKKGLPWIGFSTTELKNVLGPGDRVTVTMENVSGPGRVLAWHETLTSVKVALDSCDPSKKLTYGPAAHDHLNFGFTEPGYYSVTFRFTGVEAIDSSIQVPFLVGDTTIANARGMKAASYADLPDPSEACVGVDLAPGAGSDGGNTGPTNPWTPDAIKGLEGAVKKLGDALGNTFGQLGAFFVPAQNEPPQAAGAQTAPAAPSAEADTRVQKVVQPQTAAPGGSHGAEPVAQPGTAVSGGGDEVVGAPAPISVGEADEQVPEASGEAPIKSSIDGSEQLVAGGEDYGAASTLNSLTAGGFWSGLALGIGIMALIGGLVLFNAARKMVNSYRLPETQK